MADTLDFGNPKVDDLLHYFAKDTTERILGNFQKLNISSPANKKGRKSAGSLYRSIFWRVYNSAGGDSAKISFFYQHYAAFVETGTGRGVRYSPLPELTKLQALSRPGTTRVAKPFLLSEIRLHTRMLLDRLVARFAYMGGMYIVRSLADEKGMTIPISEAKWYR